MPEYSADDQALLARVAAGVYGEPDKAQIPTGFQMQYEGARQWSPLSDPAAAVGLLERLYDDRRITRWSTCRSRETGHGCRVDGRTIHDRYADTYCRAIVLAVAAFLDHDTLPDNPVIERTPTEVTCPRCCTTFRIRWEDRGTEAASVIIMSYPDEGIYCVELRCPQCGHSEEL